MWEGIIADVLVRVLGSYVDGLNKESIRVGVWRGDLELKNLRLRPDALAVLFETLGLDLPVTVTAGYIGLLRLEVPWKSLGSAPVQIFMHDVTVVASPVSDGDQSALELREQRLKAARLATDDAVRDAKFSMRSVDEKSNLTPSSTSDKLNADASSDDRVASVATQSQSGYRVARWGWRFTSRVVTKIVDNIQIDVENVIVQYEDSSSVRDRPYTAVVALDSLRACSTNHHWIPVFLENPSSPIVHKVLYLRGLVLNWEPGSSNNQLKQWILDPQAKRTPGQWSGMVRESSRHAIKPMDGELRIALTKSSALAAAVAGKDESARNLRNVPRVQMDLHFPQVKIILDDFQYHTLLSTIMYLSDIDRKVRPKTAKGRWFWALDRLLPRFKERRDAALRFNAAGLKARREKREEYCRARIAVVTARRKGEREPKKEAKVLGQLEAELSFKDIILFRDLTDRQLIENARSGVSEVATTQIVHRFWSLFSRGRDASGGRSRGSSGRSTPRRSRSRESVSEDAGSGKIPGEPAPLCSGEANSASQELNADEETAGSNGEATFPDLFEDDNDQKEEVLIPNFRMGFLLGRGAIELREGGFPDLPVPVSSLEFGELRLGIETRPGAGFLLEALLGTFQVIDLQRRIKVMYPRAPWTEDLSQSGDGRLNFHNVEIGINSLASPKKALSDVADTDEWLQVGTQASEPFASTSGASVESSVGGAHLHSYPHDISNAICEIRGEYGITDTALPATTPTFPRMSRYATSYESESSSSLSGYSDSALSAASLPNMEDLSVPSQAPLKYIAALRLNQEEAPEGQWARGATRMAMDLAIGGMEVLLDGPKGAFVSSIQFWHPREKMPSIMQFLSRAAAPRLASIRMDIQKALLERSVPMRMDMLIRGPRFVIPGTSRNDLSLVIDLGTFAMETSTGPPVEVTPEVVTQHPRQDSSKSTVGVGSNPDPISVRFTDYKMACTDLGLFVVSEAGKQAAERIIKPFSVHLLLQVLHNSAYIEAVMLANGKVDIPKVKLQAKLPSLRTSVSHDGFRQILDIMKGWGERSKQPLGRSGIEPNPVPNSRSVAAELEEVRHARELVAASKSEISRGASPLVGFQMRLEFEELQLELRDSAAKRIVTVSSTGTVVKLKQRSDVADFDFRVKTFTVIDGSRGATAPFRRLAYAGVEIREPESYQTELTSEDHFPAADERSFISLSYRGDRVKQEQQLAVKILSLNLLCVRETYFALADFFYLNDRRGHAGKDCVSAKNESEADWADLERASDLKGDAAEERSDIEEEYSDPFAALGMTTSGAARALKEQAERGMEFSKQALATRGHLNVTADLDGLNVTLVSADGAIGCFDVTDCQVRLTQFSNGAMEAAGELGGFGIRDLTSAHEVYSETIRYNRHSSHRFDTTSAEVDGWSLRIPDSQHADIWLEARLRNVRIVYLQRFIVILKKYFDALRDSLRPVIEMKGGIGEVFMEEESEEFPAIPRAEGRVRLNIVTENVDVVMPRHSQSPYEALRFSVPRSSITNEDLPAPGYSIGCQVEADGVNAYVLYQPPAEGEGRALTAGGFDPVLREITPDIPVSELVPFSEDICIVGKLDIWRRSRVPEVILNADGIPVLKDGEEEREYDPAKWLPAIRVRLSAPGGISARLCEAEYSILYFTFTENVIERPDIEFTDIVRGLKTPVLPRRRPVQPIMFSSNRMPPNYQILFEVPTVASVIMSGADPCDQEQRLITSELRDLVGSFEYGVDYRMTIEVNANLQSVADARPSAPSHGKTLIMPTRESPHGLSPHGGNSLPPGRYDSCADDMSRSITFTWDRPFGFRTNVMVVASDLRIIVEPELFRDLGLLTTPGFPFLKSSAPAPQLRFNGRLLILTVSRPEVWLMANQYPGDGRSLVIRGELIAKVQWAPVTGRNRIEVAANGITINLSSYGPFGRHSFLQPGSPSYSGIASPSVSSPPISSPSISSSSTPRNTTETRMLYPCDVAMKFDGSGYDPPEDPEDDPVKVPGSSLSINAESILVRVDVNDAPLILAVGSHLVRMKSSALSTRPLQPGRFDQWIDKGEDGDARLGLHFALPHSRLMFTDVTNEGSGRYVPIMEARIKNAVVKCSIPWLTNATFEFALDLFNEDKGWWEPGIESFPVITAVSKGRSGSQAVNITAERKIDLNVTPNTVSGAARVSKALKIAVEDLLDRLRTQDSIRATSSELGEKETAQFPSTSQPGTRRPSVAMFCVRNETGRTMFMWLPRDSKRRTLRGNGGEVEVDTPVDELSWTAIGATNEFAADSSRNNEDAMRCFVSLSGYETKMLSTADMGLRLVSFAPDNHDFANLTVGGVSQPAALTLVWEVTMRDGVPCGYLRSVLRLVNKTRTILEVNIGGLTKSYSAGDALKSMTEYMPAHQDRNAHRLLKAGESWSVPVHAVSRSIRVRPALFHAPENDADSAEEGTGGADKRRVCYRFKWSDPLSKVSALHKVGRKLEARARVEGSKAQDVKGTSAITPMLVCRGVNSRQVFGFSILPIVDGVDAEPLPWDDRRPSWVDVHICPPLVFENLLPRPLRFMLSIQNNAAGGGKNQIVENVHLEPLREEHIHSVGSDFNNVSIALGIDNIAQTPSPRPLRRTNPSRIVGDLHPNLAKLDSVPMGAGRYVPFKLRFEQQQSLSTRHIRAFCDFWINNRSETDLFFKDSDQVRDSRTTGSPKVFLRGRPPGSVGDRFVCFSGPWLSFQRADATEDVWVSIGIEVSEIDKPTSIPFEGLSLILDVRPAKGRFHRALVVTIRNAVWLENRTGALLQWCQPAALNPHGIALSAKVHTIKPGTLTAMHWDFRMKRKSICLRRAGESGSSDWIWSRPVNIEGVEGEFAAKMYRPKRHEQYIARVVVSKLGSGVSAVVVHREDRSTPPYRIVNHCAQRSIAFRQSGVNETHPWLVRPGKSTRYSWDDPQAPVKRRSLIVEVIEENGSFEDESDTQEGPALQLPRSESVSSHLSDVTLSSGLKTGKRERIGKRQKFELNIDMIQGNIPFAHSKAFDPPLNVSVHVEGPTKVVTFTDTEESKGTVHSEDSAQLKCEVTERADKESTNRSLRKSMNILDIAIFVKALGVSFVESRPVELAYLSISGIHFRLDRFDGQQLLLCEVQDMQLDNQLTKCTWPVVLWSPLPPDSVTQGKGAQAPVAAGRVRKFERKPFFQLTIDGPYPSIKDGIGTFRGIFLALQQMQLAADEEFVLRAWLFAVSLLDAVGGADGERDECLNGRDNLDAHLMSLGSRGKNEKNSEGCVSESRSTASLNRLYVERLELCPLKLAISFTSSRTSAAAERIGGFRSLMRTLVAMLGNVENAEFRFNALELEHVFDTTSHFRSLITEFYVSQGSNQKMVLLASNSLVGNPSALFDSIAVGARDFFVEPANAKGSADFIASIGRGSSSLLTNTVGGLFGSFAGIPKAFSQGIETAVGDPDYLAERDSIRGGRARVASSPAQGLYTGALIFGHSFASGITGLIRDPIQGAAEEGPSGFIKGLGRGVIGGVLKPITGALDLIAEPAAGFRSMMVSERDRNSAEPFRPPRAFRGVNGDRMTAYDLREALGNAILNSVNGGENEGAGERLRHWTHLVAVHASATEDDVIAFLWALIRRSAHSTHFQSRYLLDAQGNPQRAEKMRAGLITTKRLIITSLDGHVIWEYPLLDIASTNVSVEAKDYLLVGTRPIGTHSEQVAPTGSQKIHCGSVASRNDLNTALRRALQEAKSRTERQPLTLDTPTSDGKLLPMKQTNREHHRDKSLEMQDYSAALPTGLSDDCAQEMKRVHRDASADGRRGVFTRMKLPGRAHIERVDSTEVHASPETDLSFQLAVAMERPPTYRAGSIRSIRIFLVNETDESFGLINATLISGVWADSPPQVVESKSIAVLEADGSTDRVADVSGHLQLAIGNHPDTGRGVVAIRFLNPLLSSNKFAVQAPDGYIVTVSGGEKGDHVTNVITLKTRPRLESMPDKDAGTLPEKKPTVEPLLFGRSTVSPFLPPVNITPPHASKKATPDSNDPELITRLASLGFSREASVAALQANDGDLSRAYAFLLDRNC